MIKWVKKKLKKPDINLSQKETRLEQMKKNPYKRVDSENMTDVEKMDKGFNAIKRNIISNYSFRSLVFYAVL